MNLLDKPSINDPVRCLVDGLPGSGKTTLVAALSEKYKLHWIDTENGYKTLRKLPIDWQRNINLIHLPDSFSYPIAADTCVSLFKNGKGNICDAHGKIECGICKKDGAGTFTSLDFSTLKSDEIVVVDTATQISHSILAHLMRGRPIDAKPERDDWGALRKHTEMMLSQWQAAKYNLIVICHVIETALEDNTVKLVPNFGSAGMSAEFAKGFDHVVYCTIKNGKHVAGSATKFSNTVLTKSRTDFAIENYPVPSLLPLFEGSYLPSVPKIEPAPGTLIRVEKMPTAAETALANLKEKVK